MNEFFSLDSLLTFGGSTAIVTLVPTVVALVVGEAAKPYLKYVALVVALGLAFLGAAVTGGDWTRWIVALVNGLVLFLAAVGANQLTVEREVRQPAGLEAYAIGAPTGLRRARQSWL